jgi:TonB family protein
MSVRVRGSRLRPDLRWLLVVAGITGFQAGLVWWLSDRAPAEAIHAPPVLRVRAVSWDLTHALSDPLLLALPTANGFAGIGWRGASDPQYLAEDWKEPVPWLGHSETNLARGFLAASAVGIGRGMTADKPEPEWAAHQLAALPLPAGTEVRLEGDGLDWGWEVPLRAPSIAHSNVLSGTVVQVTTDSAGRIFSAVVLKSSGSKTADQQALALARSARLRVPEAVEMDGNWVWPRLVFEWRTVAPEPSAGESPGRST